MKAKNTFKQPTPIQVFSTKIIKCIESCTTYEQLEACHNMIDNSIIQLKAKGYSMQHLTAWTKSLCELIIKQQNSFKPF